MALKIQYRNRPTNSREYKLQKGVDRIVRNDTDGLFFYIVTFIGNSLGLNNFNLDVYRIKEKKREYITTFHLGDEGKLPILISSEVSSLSLPDPEEESPYSYHYSQHYL